MTNTLKMLLLTFTVGTATASFAQEATTQDADPATTQTDATQADSASDLSMGTQVQEAAAIGTPYIRETFGDWSMRCLVAEEGAPDPCQLYQLLNDADGNSVAEISMFPLANGGRAAAGATIVVPLETLLTAQVQLAVDGSAKRTYPFTFCNRAGCVSRVGFTAEEVAQFKRGNVATLRMVPAAAPDDEVILNISLTGFTAGYTSAE